MPDDQEHGFYLINFNYISKDNIPPVYQLLYLMTPTPAMLVETMICIKPRIITASWNLIYKKW